MAAVTSSCEGPALAESERRRTVCFAHSSQLLRTALLNTRYENRAALVVSLIQAYGLLNKMIVVAPPPASVADLTLFHAAYYIEYLQEHNSCHDDDDSTMEEYGLGYDCPLFDGVYEYVCAVSGSSVAMADQLVRGACTVAINWYGGWHHGKRDQASGFCYCNDVVIAILRLQRQFKHILYIDLDIHHGDGVEEAFSHSPNVVTLSLHKFTPGFFPGTGDVDSVGVGRGVYRSVNVPLQDGVTDDQYVSLFKSVTNEVWAWFTPEAVVVQCGADCLVGDDIGTFNLTLEGMGACLRQVLDWGRPTLLLGGGGYNFPNTARCWAHLTAIALNVTISTDIPEHRYFHHYGPAFELTLLPSNRSNLNTTSSLADTLSTIRDHMTRSHDNLADHTSESHDQTAKSHELQTESHDLAS